MASLQLVAGGPQSLVAQTLQTCAYKKRVFTGETTSYGFFICLHTLYKLQRYGIVNRFLMEMMITLLIAIELRPVPSFRELELRCACYVPQCFFLMRL